MNEDEYFILGSHDLGFSRCVWANASQFIMIQIAFTCVYNIVDIYEKITKMMVLPRIVYV